MGTESTYLATIDDDVVRRFEAAWRAGEGPSIEQFLPPSGPKQAATLEELVHIDLEFRWRALRDGQRPPAVEDYVERFPILKEPAVLRRLVRQEFDLRRRHGDTPNASDYVRRFPGLDATAIEALDTPTLSGQPAVASLRPGDSVGRYRLSVEHARGGFGLVWRAEDEALSREVALKQLSERLVGDRETRSRFLAEARIAARLQHPGVVPVYDVAAADSAHPYYTMKLVRGHTLTEAIRHFHESTGGEHAVEQMRLLNAFLAVARTMAFAHVRGVIHRDLKPDNIVLGDYGETVILDWGLAKVKLDEPGDEDPAAAPISGDVDLTQAGTLLGTPAYMAPEQADGMVDQVDERSDVHALGVILYQILTGSRPFPGKSLDEVLQQVREHRPARPRALKRGIPRRLEAICLKAMARRREERYPTAAELAQDLERQLADEPVSAYPEGAHERAARWARRHRTAVIAAGVALAVMVLGSLSGYFLWRERDRQDRQAAERRAEDEQRRHDARLADLQRTALSGEEFALAEMRRGRFASARALLAQAVRTVGDEPALGDLAERLQKRERRARGLVDFYRLVDTAEKLAFVEDDRRALATCERALASLELPDTAEWPAHLPAAELADPQQPGESAQLRQLREDVDRAQLLRWGLMLKVTFLRTNLEPEVVAAFRDIAARIERDARLKDSVSGRLLKAYCYYRLGELGKLNLSGPVAPTTVADHYFLGMSNFWAAKVPDSQVTRAMKEGLMAPLVRNLGLDLARGVEVGLNHLRDAADKSPTHYWTRLWLAWCLDGSGDLRGAAEAYESCAALRPEYALTYAMRGRALLRLAATTQDKDAKQRLQARGRRDLERAIELEPLDPYAWVVRADSLLLLGEVPEAMRSSARYLDMEPPLSAWRFQTVEQEKKALLTGISAAAARRVKEKETDADAHSVAADAERLLGNFDRAKRYAEVALFHQPGHVRALTTRGLLALERGDSSGAIDLEAALKTSPKHSPAALGLARARERSAKPAESLAGYDALLAGFALTDWQRGEAHLGRARALVALDRAAEARVALEAAKEYNPPGAAAQRQKLFPGEQGGR